MMLSFSILPELIRHIICTIDQRIYKAQIARMATPKQMMAELRHRPPRAESIFFIFNT